MSKHWFLLATLGLALSGAHAAESPVGADFRAKVQPILSEYCFDCHADGANKGDVAFDEFKTDQSLTTNHVLWSMVLKNLRSGIMPPAKKPRPSPEERKQIEDWVKYDAFGIDPADPDPGRVTVRRLNRVEYRNTIRDLMGVDYDTDLEFPADDAGYGFDDIGDVLTISPMLLEKYLNAAKDIVSRTVPDTSRMMPEHRIPGQAFHGSSGDAGKSAQGPLFLSYYEAASMSNIFRAEHPGHYQLAVDIANNEHFVNEQFDYNKCQLVFKVDGQELQRKEYVRGESDHGIHYEFARDWQAGAHTLEFDLTPLTPGEKQVRSLTMKIDSVTVRGPMDEKYWALPKNYERFFPKGPPKSAGERFAYARELLGNFATKAYRHPVDEDMANRLAKFARITYEQPGKTFEMGVANAMVAVLASPRFLFREENAQAHPAPGSQPLVDEYSLASRLSYFLWSSMPDEELFRLAREGNLRKNLTVQVKRMLADSRSEALVQNFTGQWLQARDIAGIPIDARAVLAREDKSDAEAERDRTRSRELVLKEHPTDQEREELRTLRAKTRNSTRTPRAELTDDLRRAMRRETEMYFSAIVHEDRNVIELVESDYTYLNESLANHYGLTNLNVTGTQMRRVKLPADSPRGGVLTMGTVLAVTSNPTRTSPVKRGLFILDNVLGNPTPPPPPNIPPLEDSEKAAADHQLTLREALEIHRAKPLCSSCHNRMDPLGLAFENFNAMGMWREGERGQTIDPSGKLITGEPFKNVQELKHILATKYRDDFYRTMTEKMLTYALGRGLEYYDVETVDQIVDRLRREDGRFSALLNGIIESSPFQKCRASATFAQANPSAGKSQ